MAMAVVVLALAALVAAPVDAHDKTYTIATLTLDQRQAVLTLKCHLAALVLGLPQRQLTVSEKTKLAATSPDALAAGIQRATKTLALSTHLRIDGREAIVSDVRFPSAETVRREGIAPSREALASEVVSVHFTARAGDEVVLTLPDHLGAAAVAVREDERLLWSGWLAPGQNTPAVSRTSPSSGWRMARTYLNQGFLHVIPMGLDHLLFVAALFIGCLRLRQAIVLATVFTIAHSATLIMAALGVVAAPAVWVEVGIALSIAVMAAWALFSRGRRNIERSGVIFAFGLLHGLGFAGALAEYGLPQHSALIALASFNIGVELAHIVALAALAAVFWAATRVRLEAGLAVAGSVSILAVSLFWTIERLGIG